ncbi:nitric oxide reductase F protein [Sedimentimonas flavescens]|uniref:nitric oxide reductase F protein n=1 Tax=Sedimentimonas flavescens TaxID=2851012 RepID=UPI001C49EB6D|nr:nitric oxide reductase F protein [Sedimentimonas flavescens]MBW0157083.1 nitric oxide reductase F protein [Sedimentimonas flavescens]MCT2539575.1 nitric oxide reductase F protein [Sedimentimonas flavescens]WBL32830.1 nitric oxide reductase F protein [Sinirhodobacter sp. HNIBRBA609]
MKLLSDPLMRAWVWLVGLSLGSTVIATSVARIEGVGITLAGATILVLAWAKARVILSRYLGLAQAPFWHRGFSIVLAIYCAGLLGLYLIA